MSELKKKLERVNLSVLQAMCTKKHLNVSAKSDKPGRKGTKLNLTKDALIFEMLKKPADDIGRVYATFLTDGEDKFIKESEPRYESMAPTEAADTADTADKQQKKDTKEKELQTKVINKLKTMVNNKKMTKSQLLEKISMMELEENKRSDILFYAQDEKRGLMRDLKKKLDTTTKNEQATPTPASTPASTPPPTPKNSPTKTDDTRDYKQVKFQGLTKDENSNAKVQVKMARVQITKSDIEKELERQNNRSFGFQHNKISYNTHWGKQGSKISSELI